MRKVTLIIISLLLWGTATIHSKSDKTILKNKSDWKKFVKQNVSVNNGIIKSKLNINIKHVFRNAKNELIYINDGKYYKLKQLKSKRVLLKEISEKEFKKVKRFYLSAITMHWLKKNDLEKSDLLTNS